MQQLASKLLSFVVSVRVMAFLFIIFAISMGMGTFIEHWYNTSTAFKLVYNAWWFEAILFLFCINFIGNIKRYNLTKFRKWPILLIHISLIVILIGAFFTRYTGFEGLISIREGESSNLIVSKKTYLKAVITDANKDAYNKLTIHKPLLLSVVGDNSVELNDEVNETSFQINVEDYTINAEQEFQEDPLGDYYLKITFAQQNLSETIYIKSGEVKLIGNKLIAFNQETRNAINIKKNRDSYFINSPSAGTFTRMSDEIQDTLNQNETKKLKFRWLYQLQDAQIVFQKFNDRGRLIYNSKNFSEDDATPDILKVSISSGDTKKELILQGNTGLIGDPKTIKVGDLLFALSFGSKPIYLPYKIRLNDFIAEKYPGTENSYASFESDLTVISENDTFDTRVFMNNILDYQGYRFFQASFHPDEKGTILSVNHDKTGTLITYTGYFLLYFSLILIFIDKKSRFSFVRRKLRKLQSVKATTGALFFFVLLTASPSLSAQSFFEKSLTKQTIDSLLKSQEINQDHAAKFGKLIVQDGNGRMKPINTFSSELLRKVYDSDHYKNLTSEQVFLSMVQYPELWYEVPIIKLEDNNRLKKILNLDSDTKYAALSDLFYDNGGYRLASHLGQAYSAFMPTNFQESLIDLDRKSNLLHFAINGKALRIFPIPDDPSDKWISFIEFEQSDVQGADSLFIKNILPLYISSLVVAQLENNYKEPNILLDKIQAYQVKYGSHVRPSKLKIDTEVFYNTINIFEKLRTWYLIAGLFLILFSIVRITSNLHWLNEIIRIVKYFIILLFLFHTIGISVRWYISGHAPWSDAYESMIYVSWATLLFGILLSKGSHLTLGAASFITSIILVVAHWNWMDPAISNLEPVLNSYWLMIHVAIIVASYGPFTLSMILSFIALVLMALTTIKNHNRLVITVSELLYITELSLTVGLVMLTIGNFLGGQWANESWGRYWGWDPKETWALISIIIYAFVIHLRIIPALKNKWVFSVAALLSYYSILMTYFGVNFYLSGLHSYANGDKVVTPVFIYYSLGLILVLSLISNYKYKKYYIKKLQH